MKAHYLALCMAFLGLTCNVMPIEPEKPEGFWLTDSIYVVEYGTYSRMSRINTPALIDKCRENESRR